MLKEVRDTKDNIEAQFDMIKASQHNLESRVSTNTNSIVSS